MWIARDKDGTLTLFKSKPVKTTDMWEDTNEFTSCNYMFLDETLFPNLKWEDEPVEVEIMSKTDVI